MIGRKPNPEAEELSREITRVHTQLPDYPAESPEYKEMVERLATLYAQKKEIPSNRISADTMLTVTGNLLGILVIVGHERANVVTSKALGFIGKAIR